MVSGDDHLTIFRYRVLIIMLVVLIILLLARNCAPRPQAMAPTATPTATTSPLPTLTATAPAEPTSIPTSTPLQTSTPTHSPTATATSFPTPTASATPTPTPTTTVAGASCGGFGEDRGSTWLVRGCDTLTRISQLTGVSLEAILAANPQITNPDLIYPGQIIVLPGR